MVQDQKTLGDILRDKGVITEEQLQKALKLQEEHEDMRLGDALVQLGLVTWDNVTNALGEMLGYEVIDLRKTEVSVEAIEMVPKSTAQTHRLLPIALNNGVLTVAITDPFDLYAMDNLRFLLNTDVRCVLAAPDAVDDAIERYYGVEESTVDNMLQEFTDSDIGYEHSGVEIEKGEETETDDAPMIRLVHLIISEAVRERASDIHIEPLANRLRIRYRIDGICHEVDAPPKKLQAALLSRVKIISDMDIAEKRKPQDGRIAMSVAGEKLDMRVSALPAYHGESIVMRLLKKESILINLQELGFHDSDYKRFQAIIRRPNGIFLVTGPTGSGKTTTLYAALNELNRPDKKIITAEDPVEYMLSGINQCEVNVKAGLTFGRILRSMLRQAPNIILVGEIRDSETANIAVEAALTGHLVFSTLHTNDAPGAITRLIDMGVKPFLVASAVQAIMAQRLVRAICPQCKVPAEVSPRELQAVGLKPEDIRSVTIYKGTGCTYCRNTGFRGRTAMFELMQMDSQLRDMTFRRETHSDIRKQARMSGMVTLREDGIRKVLAGITTIQEVVEETSTETEEAMLGSEVGA